MSSSSNEALIIIDVQNDFCPGGALAVAGGDEIVTDINSLTRKFDTVVCTQDWHPPDHSSFAANHQNGEPFSVVEMTYGQQVLWPTHCVQESEGAALHSDLETDSADIIIRKGSNPDIDSYSAFFENDQKTKTGLHGFLQDRGIEKVYLCGLATDFCVYYSAVDARKCGYRTVVIADCCRAIDLDGSLAKAQVHMREQSVEFLESAQL